MVLFPNLLQCCPKSLRFHLENVVSVWIAAFTSAPSLLGKFGLWDALCSHICCLASEKTAQQDVQTDTVLQGAIVPSFIQETSCTGMERKDLLTRQMDLPKHQIWPPSLGSCSLGLHAHVCAGCFLVAHRKRADLCWCLLAFTYLEAIFICHAAVDVHKRDF